MGDAWAVCSIAGCGIPGHYDGDRRKCKLNCPSGIALDPVEGIWISDRQNHCIRRLPGTHEKTAPGREDDIVTVTGRPKKAGFRNGHLREAMFNGPAGICCGVDGAMYVVDRENHSVRRISSHAGADSRVTTVCGSESQESGWRDGEASQALFNRPFGLASSRDGSLFVADTGNNSLRKLSTKQAVSTVLGAGVSVRSGEPPLLTPMGVCAEGNNCLFVSEWAAHRIRRLNPDGSSVIVAGSGTKGNLDGKGANAQLFHPCGMAVDAKGVVYIADWGNHCIRAMTPTGEVTTVGRGGTVIVDDGQRYVSSTLGCLDGAGTFAAFNSPQDVAVDEYGDVWVADWGNHCVRKMETLS